MIIDIQELIIIRSDVCKNLEYISLLQSRAMLQLRDTEKGPSSIKPRFYALPSSIPHHKMANISTLRRPLRELPLNIVRGKELTPKMRGKILGMKAARHEIPFIIA
jgi:hypothetical protein